MPVIRIEALGDLAVLEARWRRLEVLADARFFRGWTYLGCLAAQRLAGASLLSVTGGGEDLALALLGRTRRGLFLNETGDPALDAPFIEHNGLLVRHGSEGVVAPALRHAARAGSVTLSGIDGAHLAAARTAGWVSLGQSRLAPAIDLAALDRPFIETLSANARAQIRRAQRLYGPGLALRRATGTEDALAVFGELVLLHQAAWEKRGKPGAFADPAIRHFHRTLIERAVPRGEADLLDITAGPRRIGTLYNFLSNGRVMSYQSGFVYSDDARQKPGLVCHALAIAFYAAEGRRLYDLLGGADRYKTTLAPHGETLHWATLRRRLSATGATVSVLRRLRR